MGRVKIKGSNHCLDVYLFQSDSDELLYEELKEKLRPFAYINQLEYEVFFHGLNHLNPDVVHKISLLCHKYQIPFENHFKEITVLSEPLRSGQNHFFKGNVLLLQDIRSNVSITIEKGDLYVLGRICGMVHLTDKNQCIYTNGLKKATIQIHSSFLQSSTKSGSVKVYHNGVNIVINRQEDVWEESLWLPVERVV